MGCQSSVSGGSIYELAKEGRRKYSPRLISGLHFHAPMTRLPVNPPSQKFQIGFPLAAVGVDFCPEIGILKDIEYQLSDDQRSNFVN